MAVHLLSECVATQGTYLAKRDAETASHVKAESGRLARETAQTARLLHRLGGLAASFRRIAAVNRNVGLFTTGYPQAFEC